jgi:hypothetical protein
MNRYDRLRRLEGDAPENKEDVEIRRQETCSRAAHANRCVPEDADEPFCIRR